MAGTPKDISEQDIEVVIERIADGLTLKQSCTKSKYGYANIVKRIGQSDELKNLHARAREEYARRRVQDMHDIAKNPKIDPARARIMIDVIKWEAARVLPKEFGDRVQQEVIITNNTTLSERMSKARRRAQEQAITLARPPAPAEDAKGDERA